MCALTACELAVDTSNLDNGKGDAGTGDSGGAGDVAAPSIVDGSIDATEGMDAADATVDAGAGFCNGLAATENRIFCEDWDQPDRTTPFSNGWSLIHPSPTQTITFAGAGEPVFSAPRSLKLFASEDAGSSRVALTRSLPLKAHVELHFKVYPTTPLPDPNSTFMELTAQSGICTLAIRYDDINTYCPDYLDTVPFPGLPMNTWSELEIVIDNAQAGATFSVTGPFGTLKGAAPMLTLDTIYLGQDESDFDQTVFYDDIWATGN